MSCLNQCTPISGPKSNNLTRNEVISTWKTLSRPPINYNTSSIHNQTISTSQVKSILKSSNYVQNHKDNNSRVNFANSNLYSQTQNTTQLGFFSEQLNKKCKKSLSGIKRQHKKNQSLGEWKKNQLSGNISQMEKTQKLYEFQIVESKICTPHYPMNTSYQMDKLYQSNQFEKSLGLNSISHNQSIYEYPDSEMVNKIKSGNPDIKRPTSCIISKNTKSVEESGKMSQYQNTQNTSNKPSQKTSSIMSPIFTDQITTNTHYQIGNYQIKRQKYKNNNNPHSQYLNNNNIQNTNKNLHQNLSNSMNSNTHYNHTHSYIDSYNENHNNHNNHNNNNNHNNLNNNNKQKRSLLKNSDSKFQQNHIFNYGTQTVESGWGSSENFSSLVESNAIFHLNNVNRQNESQIRDGRPSFDKGDKVLSEKNDKGLFSKKKQTPQYHPCQNERIQNSQVLGYSLSLSNTLKVTGQFTNSQKNSTNLNHSTIKTLYKPIQFLCQVKQINFTTLKNIPSDSSVYNCIMANYRRISHKNLVDVYSIRTGIQGFTMMMEYTQNKLKNQIAKVLKLQQKKAICYLRDIIEGLLYLQQNKMNINLDVNVVNLVNGCAKLQWCNINRIVTHNIKKSILNNVFQLGRISYFMLFGKVPQEQDIVVLKNLKQTNNFKDISQKYYNFIERILIYDQKYRPSLNQCLIHPLFY